MKKLIQLTRIPAWMAASVMILLAAGCQSQTTPKPGYESALLVDVRTPEEFAEGTAKGAVNIPLSEIGTRLEELSGRESIVLFCRSGSRSAQALEILRQHGFRNAVNGGTWQQVDARIKK
jgi:phage shock protein E